MKLTKHGDSTDNRELNFDGQCISNVSVAGAAQGSRCSASTVCFQLTDKKEVYTKIFKEIIE